MSNVQDNAAHTCSYSCDRPECIKAQRDELAAATAQEAVAYLDIGAGGYLDIGSDLSDEQLLALPKGRHALAIIGTFGIDGYVAAAPTVTDPVAAYERELAAGATHEHALHAICTPAAPGIDILHRALVSIAKGCCHAQKVADDALAEFRIDASPKGDLHADDLAVDAFAAAMKAKLADARAKGRSGWNGDEPGMHQRLSDMLRNHVEKGDPRDVANFCMFLHQRGESISPRGDSEAPAYTTGHCENHKKPGGCPLHNLQCSYPQCDRQPASDAEVRP